MQIFGRDYTKVYTSNYFNPFLKLYADYLGCSGLDTSLNRDPNSVYDIILLFSRLKRVNNSSSWLNVIGLFNMSTRIFWRPSFETFPFCSGSLAINRFLISLNPCFPFSFSKCSSSSISRRLF